MYIAHAAKDWTCGWKMRVTCLAVILKLTYKLVQPGLRLSLKKARYFFNSDSTIYLQIHAAGPEFVTKIRAFSFGSDMS